MAVVAFAGCWKLRPPIRVGVLHSQTGTMAISEQAVLNATLLAIDEINEEGGLLGRRVEPIIADGASDPVRFAEEAKRLIDGEGVSVIFGCWTSASRKSVVPVVEERDGLLFYPLQYEGIEQSPNVIYTGATPNQQVVPAVSFALREFGPRVFLVGSDYVFPRMANLIIHDAVRAIGGEIVGEEYLPLGGKDVLPTVERIQRSSPDVILNTINGDSNVAFFAALREVGITPSEIPTLSFSLGETELAQMDAGSMAGDYAAWNYFQSVDSPQNHQFIDAYRERFGEDSVTSDPMDAAYTAVQLWARAVRSAGSTEPEAIRRTIGGEGFHAPAGLVYVDVETQHTWKPVRIGRARADGQFDVVWESEKAVRPMPFPIFRTREQWEQALAQLRAGWGGAWAKPATEAAEP